MTYVEVWRPSIKCSPVLYDALWVAGGSLAMAGLAQVAVPLPFSPVPITGQTLGAVLLGAVLGSRLGVLCLLVYLAEGLAGLPVFTGGGFGLARLAGPTGGYLVGMIAAAYLTGRLAERGWDRRLWTALLAMLLGNVAIYVFGLAWLARFVGGDRVLALGLLPFLLGDALKLMLAGTLLPSGWALFGRHRV